jgi:hypothetical protein
MIIPRLFSNYNHYLFFYSKTLVHQNNIINTTRTNPIDSLSVLVRRDSMNDGKLDISFVL